MRGVVAFPLMMCTWIRQSTRVEYLLLGEYASSRTKALLREAARRLPPFKIFLVARFAASGQRDDDVDYTETFHQPVDDSGSR